MIKPVIDLFAHFTPKGEEYQCSRHPVLSQALAYLLEPHAMPTGKQVRSCT